MPVSSRKNFILLSLAAGLILAGSAPGRAEDFEGRIKFKITDAKQRTQLFDYFAKGAQVRIEPQSKERGAVLLDQAKNKMTVLLPEKRQYMTMDAPAASAAKGDGEKVKLERTGKMDTILAYPAEHWIAKGEKARTEIWGTTRLGRFAGLRKSQNEGPAAWERQLGAQGLFPLKVTHVEGLETTQWEATEIERRRLDDGMFRPPSGYSEMKMPAMPPEMKGMDMKKLMEKYKQEKVY